MWYFRALHAHLERALHDQLGDSPAKLLDAGCGTGGLIGRLAPRHPHWCWVGLDASELACDFARRRLGASAEIVEGRAEALPFDDARFDAVVSADVLYHIDDDAAALRECVRVLRPGGALVINVPAYQWLWSYHDEAVHSKRRYSRSGLLAKLVTAGLAPVRATYWNTLPFPLVVVRRKLLPAPADGSDVHLFPGPIETLFNGAMALERAWLRTLGALPFGTSVFVVARKPGA